MLNAASQLVAGLSPFSPYRSSIPSTAALTDRRFPKAAYPFRWHHPWHQPAILACQKSANFLSHYSSFPDRFDKIHCVPGLGWASRTLPCGDLLRGAAGQGLDPRAAGIVSPTAPVGATWGACRLDTSWFCSCPCQSCPSFPSRHWGSGNGLMRQPGSWRGAEHGRWVLQQNPQYVVKPGILT